MTKGGKSYVNSRGFLSSTLVWLYIFFCQIATFCKMQSESIQRKQWREKAFCVNRLVRTAGEERRVDNTV